MKCPVCLSEKAYRRDIETWLDAFVAFLLLMPFKCHHCFHRFYAFWPLTLGKTTRPPKTTRSDCRRNGASHKLPDRETSERPTVMVRRRSTTRDTD